MSDYGGRKHGWNASLIFYAFVYGACIYGVWNTELCGGIQNYVAGCHYM
jgi:hypothetical protein